MFPLSTATLFPATCDEVSDLPAWYLSTIVGVVVVIAGIGMVLPGVVTGDTRAAPVLAPGIGVVWVVSGYLLVASLSGLPRSAVFIDRPTLANLRWAFVGVVIALVLPVSIFLTVGGQATLSVGTLNHVAIAIGASLLIGLWTGTLEEVLLRGYLLGVIGHRWHWPGAILVSAGIFGLLHHGHGDAFVGRLLYISVTFVAGVFFALVTLATGSIWNAVALHAVWNTVYSPHLLVFGDEVGSSLTLARIIPDASHGLFGGTIAGPTESPLVLVLFLGLCAIAVWFFGYRGSGPPPSNS